MPSNILNITPVLPSEDIARDVAWYENKLGFKSLHNNKMYAVLQRNNISIHLQWHANTKADPLLGGSVIKIMVKNIKPIFMECVENGSVKADSINFNTAWNTNEFGLFDLNNNAIFFVETIRK
ncbi:MAG: glyoxalase/bleomycin resistance/extradiol dioxygenase family protein [Oceanihabitans sp.]